MNTQLCIVQHTHCTPELTGDARSLSAEEIAERSASAPTLIERQRWRVIGLLLAQMPIADIVAATGYRPRTIRKVAQRYREAGSAGLVDGRQHRRGATPLLSDVQQRELGQALLSPPPDGGRWSGPKVARWIAAKTGRRVHRQRGWEYLRRLGAAPATDEQTDIINQ